MCGCSEVAEDLLFLAPVHRGRSLVGPCVSVMSLSKTELSFPMCGCSEVAEDLLFLAPVHRGRSLVGPFGSGSLLGLRRGQTQMQTALRERIERTILRLLISVWFRGVIAGVMVRICEL